MSFVDAGKTVTAGTSGVSSTDPDAELSVFTKQAASYSAADLPGTWQGNTLVSGDSAPWWERDTLTINPDGSSTVSWTAYDGSTGSATGNLAISSAGAVTWTCADCSSNQSFSGFVDAGKTVMVFTDTWASDAGTHEIKIFTKDAAIVPNAPTNVMAGAGNARAAVSFTPPASNGGPPVTSYTVTSNPGSKTGTGTGSPIIVSGLQNGTPYTFAVTANNATGPSLPSSASNRVTPSATPPASMADLEGIWNSNSIETGFSSLEWKRMTLTVASDGTFTYSQTRNDGTKDTGSGAFWISPGGIFVTTDNPNNVLLQIDSGKTVLAGTDTSDSGKTELMIFVKQAASYSLGDLAGSWGGNFLISGSTSGGSVTQSLTVKSDGTFTGTMSVAGGTPSTVSGALSISSTGESTCTSGFCVDPTYESSMDAGKSLTVGTLGANPASPNPDAALLGVFTKQAASYSMADLAGMWQMNLLASAPDAPYWERGAVTINSDGTFTSSSTGSDGSTSSGTGALSISSTGVIACVSGECDKGGSTPVMSASKTVMVSTETSNGSGRIKIFTKSAAGSLTVTIGPAAAVSAGAMWSVDGGAWQASGAVVPNLSVGPHTVAFNTITGWTAPTSQTAAITNGHTTSLSGAYTQQTPSGSVTVTIGPAAAVSAGAMWKVDSGAWQASGATVSGLSVSMHTVAFKAVQGWTAPSSQTFNIKNGQTASLSGAYAPPPTISVTSPSGGSFYAGAKCAIAWTYLGNPGSSVSIALLQAGSKVSTIASSTSVGSNGTGSYSWTIPAAQGPGTNYEVQVSSTTMSSCKATSNNFTIVAPSISVTSPKGGETWSAGEKHNITWSYLGNPGSSVKIELVKGSATAATIVSSASIGNNGTGSYAWSLPSTLVTGSDYKVRVTSTTNSSLTSMSQGAFTIKGGISITVTSPAGGESWAAGSPHNITWSYQGSPGSTVNIVLLNNGKAVSTIKSAASIGKSGIGSYAWTIPKATAGGSYQVQVTSTANSFCTSISNYFTIH
jgi:hypothetical protein